MSASPRLTRNVFIKQRLKCLFFRKIKQANPLPSNMKTDIIPFSSRNTRSSESSHSEILDPDSLKGVGVLESEVKFDSSIKKIDWNRSHGIEAFLFVFTKVIKIDCPKQAAEMFVNLKLLVERATERCKNFQTEITILRF